MRDELKSIKYHNEMVLKKLLIDLKDNVVDIDMERIEEKGYLTKFIEDAEEGKLVPSEGVSAIRIITEPNYVSSLIGDVQRDMNKMEAEILSQLNGISYEL